MKQFASLVVLALGCSVVHANDGAVPAQPNRMSVCQKEATASGKKGEERKAVLRACMAGGKAAKSG